MSYFAVDRKTPKQQRIPKREKQAKIPKPPKNYNGSKPIKGQHIPIFKNAKELIE